MNKTDDLSINLNTLDEKGVYEAFHVEGNEEEALTDSYFELYQLLGAEAMLKLYKHYHGDKIDCPMKLYRAEYVADLAKQWVSKWFLSFLMMVGRLEIFTVLTILLPGFWKQ